MSKEDLEICFLPHTTSKLKKEEELIGIKTLGFRGEALSSIAAISYLTIKSKMKRAVAGTEIKINNGKIENISLVGMPQGTEVTVKHLFHSIPARKKFLKSEKTEFRHITDIVTAFALMHPSIHFVFTHNKKIIFDLPKKSNVLERLKLLVGEQFYENIIPFKFEEGYIHLSGFLGKPNIASKQNQKQFVFVNKRNVTDKLISLAVRESYGTLLSAVNTPVFLLNISIPHEIVDVNVHPRKDQISYINPNAVFNAVRLAVTESLKENNLNFQLAHYKREVGRSGETTSFAGQLLKDTILPWNSSLLGKIQKNAPVVQVHNNYILTIIDTGIFLVDQHAAHERILYEKFLKAFHTTKKKKERILLPKPIPLHLSLGDVLLLEEYVGEFTALGFEIEPFHKNTVIIRAIPSVFKGRNITKIVQDMLGDLSENSQIKNIDLRTQRMLAFLSCRAAIKKGDNLTSQESKELLRQLDKTPNKETCPHGRPTRVDISLREIDKIFKR